MENLILVSKQQYQEINSPLSIEGYDVYTDINMIYKKMLTNKSNLLITHEYILENAIESDFVNIIDTVFLLFNSQIIYFGKEYDYISTYYGNSNKIRTYYEDIEKISHKKLAAVFTKEYVNTEIKMAIKEEKEAQLLVKETAKHLAKIEAVKTMPESTLLIFLSNNLDLVKNILASYTYMYTTYTQFARDIEMTNSINGVYKGTLDTYMHDLGKASSNITELSNYINKLKAKYDRLVEKYTEYNLLVESLKEYGVYNEAQFLDIAVDTDIENTNHPPIVIYFKEYSYLSYFKTYFSHLPSIIESNMNLTTKSLIIERPMSNIKPLYDDYFETTTEIDMGDLLGNSKLIHYGHPHDILNILYTNELKIDVILIWDRTCNTNYYITGKQVQALNLASSKSIATKLNLNIDDTICKDSKFEIPYFDDFNIIKKSNTLSRGFFGTLPLTLEIFGILNVYTNAREE